MDVNLVTSLHLDHGAMTLDHRPGDPLTMQSFVPAGLLSMKAHSDAAGVNDQIRVTELNGLVNQGVIANDDGFYDHITDIILRPGDGMIGLMTDADSLHHTVTMARLVKERSPQTLVVLGGPAPSPISKLTLERFPFIDMVVRGEGEVTFTETLQHLDTDRDLAGIKGLTWRAGDSIVMNADRKMMPELEDLPIPEFEAYGMDPDAALYLDVGRGCPFKCHFCATAPFWDRKFRMKSIERIVTELTLVRDRYQRNHVGFSHDIFTTNKRWTLRFCQELIDHPIGVTWACSTRTDVIDEEILEAMAEAGCVEIYYGIETGSQEMQATIHKNLDLARSREIVAATNKSGIRPVTGFIVGYPTETEETFNQTLTRYFDFLQVGGFRAHLFTLCPFQEAPMYADGYKIDRPAAYFEAPLTPAQAALGAELRLSHPDVFTSLFRFDATGVPVSLIDGTEEIASRMVVLKSLWPLLLPHYDRPLDWYSRWISWIEEYNAEHRPATALPFHGEIDDMIAFIESELVRLELTGTPLAALVQYEKDKVQAARELAAAPSRPPVPSSGVLEPGTALVPAGEYLVRPMPYELGSLLSGEFNGGEPVQVEGRSVVLAKVNGDDLTTVQVGRRSAALLNRLARNDGPLTVQELAGSDPVEETLALAGAMVRAGLLAPAA